MQDKFSWKAVATAAITAGVLKGGVGSLAENATKSVVMNTALQGAINSTVSQGVNIAVGLQKSFSWKELAISAASAPAASKASNWRDDKAYVLDGIFFYAEGKDGYSQFRGALPSGISFRQSRDEILRRLGPAKWQRSRPDGSLVAEKWNVGPYFMHITWSRKTNRPTVIVFGSRAFEP